MTNPISNYSVSEYDGQFILPFPAGGWVVGYWIGECFCLSLDDHEIFDTVEAAQAWIDGNDEEMD